MSALHEITAFTGRIPSGIWVALMVANIALLILTWRVARRRIRRAGERAAHPDRFDASRKRDVALTVASLVPAALFWLMVLAGSFQGLVAFGRTVLDWKGGAEYLVPGTLDGVSVTFAFLAFRAIHKRTDPSRCYKVVWAASLASATVNFAYEYSHTHNVIAGGYLALLSVFGMVIFHEFLAQFEEGAEYVRRAKRPPYGLRWCTAPSSTFQAFIAWENFPPADGTAATVLNGLANLERVRVIKRNAADVRVLERHARNLAAARRKAELDAARSDPAFIPPSTSADEPEAVTSSVPRALPVPKAIPSPKALPVTKALPVPSVPVSEDRADEADPGDARVPTKPAKIVEWAQMWVQMYGDGDLVYTSLNDEERARTGYGVTSRHLRSVRSAVLKGTLARKAEELGVELPADFVGELPQRINGHEVTSVAA